MLFALALWNVCYDAAPGTTETPIASTKPPPRNLEREAACNRNLTPAISMLRSARYRQGLSGQAPSP